MSLYVTVIVPCNTILQLPANTLTWAQLIDGGPSLVGYEIQVQGNILNANVLHRVTPPAAADLAGWVNSSIDILNIWSGILGSPEAQGNL